jgi:hypothetical protein
MTEPWIRVHANLHAKPVVSRAIEALGVKAPEAIGLLVTFWGAVSQHAPNGDVSGASDVTLERWAGWTRKAGRFAAFIREQHTINGRVREWDEYHGVLEAKREKERERKRLERERKEIARADGHADVTRTNAGSPPDVTRTVQPTRAVRDEDETVRDELQPSSSSAREELLNAVPHRASWEAELNAARQGMHGPPLSDKQLDEAIRDYLGNGASKTPNLRHFRTYLHRAARPVAGEQSTNGAADPTVAALEKWKRDTDAKERSA